MSDIANSGKSNDSFRDGGFEDATQVSTTLTYTQKTRLEKKAKMQGHTISSYIRWIIIKDLNK